MVNTQNILQNIWLALGCCVLLTSAGCLQQHNNYGVVGLPVCSDDGQLVTVLVAENEAMTYTENGGFRKTSYRTTYWLKQYETASGKLVKKKNIITPSENNRKSVSCYGGYNNTIWLYANGITGYSLTTLEENANEKKMAAVNGVKKTLFPYGGRLVYPFVENGFIDFVADNGEQYRLLLANLQIVNKELLHKEENDEERKLRRLLHDDEYGARGDTLLNKMYILAKDSTAAAGVTPANNTVNDVAFRMKLFTADFTTRPLGAQNSFSSANIHLLCSNTFLNPCFAKDTDKDLVIHLSNPGGFLLIHQDVLGEKSKAIITRIGTNGHIQWETSTDVSPKISGCIKNRKYFFIVTNKDYMLSPFIGKDALCIIDTETGQISRPLLSQ